jgi:diguanylate cyclase (GGDEF)-like protein/PAS domain S-box-containing protein
MSTEKIGLKTRMLLPLGLVLAGLLAAFVLVFYVEESDHLGEDFARDLRVVQEFYDDAVREGERRLAAQTLALQRDARLAGALERRDRAALARLSVPLLVELKAGFDITHLYFLDPGRVTVFRAHFPGWQGDRIGRATALEAERTGRPASGVEIGPAGTLALRRVQPWRRDGRLIGYLEISMDVESLLLHALRVLRAESVVLLDKRYLERDKWERGMRLLGRETDWEQLPDRAVSFQTLAALTPGLRARLLSSAPAASHGRLEVSVGGRVHYGGLLPLRDVRGRHVGELLVLRDFSEHVARYRELLAGLVGAGATLGLALFALFYRILDRTERELAERQAALLANREALEQGQREWTAAFDAVQDLMFMHDRDMRITRANRAYLERAGLPAEEVLGRPYWQVFPRRDGPLAGCLQALDKGAAEEEEVQLEDGRIYRCRYYPIFDSRGAHRYSMHIMQDVTEHRQFEARLHHQATHDALTGLPNRYLLTDRLEQALVHAVRAGRHVAVLVLDLDRFKQVNDALGHSAGDELLQQVTARLGQCVRAGDTLARLGGDEFVVVLVDLAQPDDVMMVGQKILSALAQPLPLDGQELVTTVSIGTSLFPRDGRSANELLKNADAALLRAKQRGRNNIQCYTDQLSRRTREALALASELRHAIGREELRLHYQPQVDLLSGHIVGAEALIRWQHGTRGLVPPDQFIPLAEETGLIVPIGEWVLDVACEQARRWRDEGLPPIAMAVNLSAHQLRRPDLAAIVAQALRVNDLDPRWLELELTESAVMDEPEEATARLRELHRLGVSIALDDFGTGYSSLNHLKRFPISRLKVDRSFVQNITTNLDDAAIVSAIIAMAHGLEMSVVAEGIETNEQLHYLRQRHCNVGQGYHFSRPVPAEQLGELLRRGEPFAHMPRAKRPPRAGEGERSSV